MKKGCFLTSIIVFTLLVGSAFYIYKQYGHRLKAYGKDMIIQLTVNKISDKIDDIPKSEYIDSLKVVVNDFTKEVKKKPFKEAMKKLDYLKITLSRYVDDGKLDSLDFTNIKKYIEDERSEKNGN